MLKSKPEDLTSVKYSLRDKIKTRPNYMPGISEIFYPIRTAVNFAFTYFTPLNNGIELLVLPALNSFPQYRKKNISKLNEEKQKKKEEFLESYKKIAPCLKNEKFRNFFSNTFKASLEQNRPITIELIQTAFTTAKEAALDITSHDDFVTNFMQVFKLLREEFKKIHPNIDPKDLHIFEDIVEAYEAPETISPKLPYETATIKVTNTNDSNRKTYQKEYTSYNRKNKFKPFGGLDPEYEQLRGCTYSSEPITNIDKAKPKRQILYMFGNYSCCQEQYGEAEDILAHAQEYFNVTLHMVNPRGVADSEGRPDGAADLYEDYLKIAILHIEKEIEKELGKNYRTEKENNSSVYQQAKLKASRQFEIFGHSLGAGIGSVVACMLHQLGYTVFITNDRSFAHTFDVVTADIPIPGLKQTGRLLGEVTGWGINAQEAYDKIPDEFKMYTMVKYRPSAQDDTTAPKTLAQIKADIKLRKKTLAEMQTIANEGKKLHAKLSKLPKEPQTSTVSKEVEKFQKKFEKFYATAATTNSSSSCPDLKSMRASEIANKLYAIFVDKGNMMERYEEKISLQIQQLNNRTNLSQDVDGVIPYKSSLCKTQKSLRKKEEIIIDEIIQAIDSIKAAFQDLSATQPIILEQKVSDLCNIRDKNLLPQLKPQLQLINKYASQIRDWSARYIDPAKPLDLAAMTLTELNTMDIEALNKIKDQRLNGHYVDAKKQPEQGHDIGVNDLYSHADSEAFLKRWARIGYNTFTFFADKHTAEPQVKLEEPQTNKDSNIFVRTLKRVFA